MQQEMTTLPNRTAVQELIELKTGRSLPELLHELYEVHGKSEVQIAKDLGISRPTVRNWLGDFGIKRRV